MALTITFNKTTKKVKLDDSDSSTGKLQIQFNDSDIYNNLSGSTNDVTSGSGTYIPIPLLEDGSIPKGKYYFNYVDNATTYSGTVTVNFQIDEIQESISTSLDTYSPLYSATDSTSYTIENATVISASRTLITQYPAGSNQTSLIATSANLTDSLYNRTRNVWTGAMQNTLTWSATFTIAVTTGYSEFTYITSGTKYTSTNISCHTELSELYSGIENLRSSMSISKRLRRSNYKELKDNYSYVLALATQYREAISTGNTASLATIASEIELTLNESGVTVNCDADTPRKIYGVNSEYANEGTINGELEILAADAALLNSSEKTLITVPAGYVAQIHSAAIVQTSVQTSGTIGAITFQIATSNSALRVLGSVTKASEANAVGRYYQFDIAPNAGSRASGDQVIIQTTSDEATAAYSNWKVIFNYSLINVA